MDQSAGEKIGLHAIVIDAESKPARILPGTRETTADRLSAGAAVLG